jgi:hypothetical protein
MLPRIFTGTLLSVCCILAAQVAEHAFDNAIEELNAAIAAPATPVVGIDPDSIECLDPATPPCLQDASAQETPAKFVLYATCESTDGEVSTTTTLGTT